MKEAVLVYIKLNVPVSPTLVLVEGIRNNDIIKCTTVINNTLLTGAVAKCRVSA